jgi:RNA 2',3'-cyclic 3'-phosphodiesterase
MTSRLFIAVWPPDHVAEALRALHRKDERGVRFVPPDNWHVTLRFLGDADERAASDALDRAALPSAQARLGPAVDVLAQRALVVPVSGVDALAAAVIGATRRIGEPPGRRFVGHLTIARLARRVRLPRAMGAMIAAEFDVDEVALVRSRLDPRGARYETVRTWPTA